MSNNSEQYAALQYDKAMRYKRMEAALERMQDEGKLVGSLGLARKLIGMYEETLQAMSEAVADTKPQPWDRGLQDLIKTKAMREYSALEFDPETLPLLRFAKAPKLRGPNEN
jgi:hypothetical protein